MTVSDDHVILPDISVIVPCYNVEKYVGQCMTSLLCQFHRNMEIIAVDDGSTDKTGQLLDYYASIDGRIRVLHQKNGGYGKAMNAGMSEARGKYLGILESDDFCSPYMFAALFKLCEDLELDVAKSDFYRYWSKDHKKVHEHIAPPDLYGQVISPHINYQIFFGTPSIWSAIYRRQMLLDMDIKFTETPGASYQDAAFNAKVWCSAKRIMLCDTPFVFYRQDNESSSVNNKGKIYNVCTEYDESINFAREKAPFALPYLEYMRYTGYIWNYNRIADKFKFQFACRMGRDFARALSKKFVDFNLFSPEDVKRYKKIAFNPKIFWLKNRLEEIWR